MQRCTDFIGWLPTTNFTDEYPNETEQLKNVYRVTPTFYTGGSQDLINRRGPEVEPVQNCIYVDEC